MLVRLVKYLFLFILLPNLLYAEEPSNHPRKLIIYTHKAFMKDWMQIGHPVKRAFEFECNCQLEFISLGSAGTILSRLMLEGDTSPADLVLGLDMSLIDKALDSGLFTPHNIHPKNLTLPIKWTNNYFLPYDYGYLAFVYNSKKLKNPPTSFQELIEDPKLKIIIQEPRSSTVSLGLVAWVRLLYKDQAPEVWKKLKKKIITVTKSWSESYGLFLQGEADMVLSYSTSPAYHMIAEGNYDIKAAEFKEGHYLQIELIGKLKSSKNSDLADKFMHFVLSRSCQRIIPIHGFMLPIIDLGTDLPKEYSYLFTPKKVFLASPEEMKKYRNIWIKEWLQALASKN